MTRSDEPSLRIAFLDSWVRDPARGSGSAAAIAGLRDGLEARGHRVRVVEPRRPGAGLAARLAYNLRLPLRLNPGEFDLLVGFDFDGCFLPRPGAPPFVVSLKGVAADEQRFESGIPRARLRVQAALEAWSVARADGVVAPSRYSAGWARRAYGARPETTAVVPEGLDLSRWGLDDDFQAPHGPGSEGYGDGRPRPTSAGEPATVLSVARQYRRKNTAALVDAAARLARGGTPVRLRVVGGGPELERLRSRAARSGLGGGIRLLGELPSASVRDEYRSADIFCLPSLQEGFGIAFLEAMAAGLPVVACRAGAAPEVIEDGKTGLLCEPGSVTSLARSLRRLATSPGLRREMGERGRRRADRHGWPRIAGRFLASCRRLLRRRGGGGRTSPPGLFAGGPSEQVRQLPRTAAGPTAGTNGEQAGSGPAAPSP